MKIILVVGAPRSGTTFLASQVCQRVKTPLLPEAQWIIEKMRERELGYYSKNYWENIRNIDALKNINGNSVIQIFNEECSLRNTNLNDYLVEHTPQNILYLNHIIQLFSDHDLKIIAPLRKPLDSIISLKNQFWFKKGLFRAAAFNLKCLFYLYYHRDKIIFYNLEDNRSAVDLDELFGKSHNDISYYNAVTKTPDLLESHQYFTRNFNSTKRSTLARTLSIPSHLIYLILKR